MKTAVLRKFLTATILCLIVVLTMLTVLSVCYAEENAAATETGDGSAVTAPAEGETSGDTDGTEVPTPRETIPSSICISIPTTCWQHWI